MKYISFKLLCRTMVTESVGKPVGFAINFEKLPRANFRASKIRCRPCTTSRWSGSVYSVLKMYWRSVRRVGYFWSWEPRERLAVQTALSHFVRRE